MSVPINFEGVPNGTFVFLVRIPRPFTPQCLDLYVLRIECLLLSVEVFRMYHGNIHVLANMDVGNK